MPPSAPDSGRPSKRITIRDIAKDTGLHFTTVAEALRNSRRIRKETREKVQAAAARLGYRPDPVLSALLAYRTQNQRHEFQGVLAWVCNHPARDYFESGSGFYHDCWQGAVARAEHFGYKVEGFWLGERGMSLERAARILSARGILGLLLAPQPLEVKELALPWERFCSVRIGYSLSSLELPIVAPDQFYNTYLLYQKLAEIGYRRIGLVCPGAVDERVGHGFTGGYLSARERQGGPQKKIPIYLDQERHGDAKAFLSWFERHRPDAIMLVPGPIYYQALRSAGYRIPVDVALASLDGNPFITKAMQPSFSDYGEVHPTGVHQAGERVGETAVDVLVEMVNRNAAGIAAFFRKTLVSGRFVQGNTTENSSSGLSGA